MTLPIIAFFLRIRAGMRQINFNRCSEIVRRFQLCVFVFGILPLVLVDCFVFFFHLMPQGDLFSTTSDLLFWASVFVIYLTSMVVAMYPDPAESNEVGSDES